MERILDNYENYNYRIVLKCYKLGQSKSNNITKKARGSRD